MAWIYRTFESPGAAMPSSHVAIALCTVYFSFRYLPKIRYVHLAVAILLSLATVYCRYHYALDVVAGVLTTALLLPLSNYLYSKFGDSRLPASGAPPGADARGALLESYKPAGGGCGNSHS
jgi:membrane-associated phospholipid phosphatase